MSSAPTSGEGRTGAHDARSIPVRKAIVPLAGLGTRLLPITKAVPKGMLPIIDKPVVQYVVEEAEAAGLADVVLVTGDNGQVFRSYFGRAPEMEGILAERDNNGALARLRAATGQAAVGFIRQDRPAGLGDAVLRCADHVGGEPFALLFGDNVVSSGDDLLSRMIAARRRYGGTILALMEIPPDEISARVVAAFEATEDPAVVLVTNLVEKPAAAEAPSNWIMIGRCICDPAIFEILRQTQAGHGGEIQLTDALRTLAQVDTIDGGGVRGLLFRGRRFDTGNRQDYLRTTVELACTRSDMADEFLPWLRHYVSTFD